MWAERLNTTLEALRVAATAAPTPAVARTDCGSGEDGLGVLMEGILKKKTEAYAREIWHKRFAVLTANSLIYSDKHANVATLLSGKECRVLELSRFTARTTFADDGSAILELFCPYDRPYVLPSSVAQYLCAAECRGVPLRAAECH